MEWLIIAMVAYCGFGITWSFFKEKRYITAAVLLAFTLIMEAEWIRVWINYV